MFMKESLLVWMEGNEFECLTSGRMLTVFSSLVENYPGFETILRESLRCLVGADVERRVEIGMAKDGSGVGGKIHFLSHLTVFAC